MGPKILLVEPDIKDRRLLTALLTAHGYTVFQATNAEEALKRARQEKPEVILVDLDAHGLFRSETYRDDIFSAAMLHDAGKLVMASELLHLYAQVLDQNEAGSAPMCELEREIVGASHAEIGGYLLMEWGLPCPVVEAVTYHHKPSRVRHEEFGVTPAVHVANALVSAWEFENGLRPEYSVTSLDIPLLERLGVAGKVPAWQQEIDEICSQPLDDVLTLPA